MVVGFQGWRFDGGFGGSLWISVVGLYWWISMVCGDLLGWIYGGSWRVCGGSWWVCADLLLSDLIAVGPVAIAVADASAPAVVGSVGGWFCLWSWYEF